MFGNRTMFDLREWGRRALDRVVPPEYRDFDTQRENVHEAITEQALDYALVDLAESIYDLVDAATHHITLNCPGLDAERIRKAMTKELWLVYGEHEEFARQGAYLS